MQARLSSAGAIKEVNNHVRKPNQKELRQLEKQVLDEIGSSHSDEEVESIRRLVRAAHITVFELYIADSPGYRGKVMVVVWSGGPGLHQTYIWETGEMVAIEQEL